MILFLNVLLICLLTFASDHLLVDAGVLLTFGWGLYGQVSIDINIIGAFLNKYIGISVCGIWDVDQN